MHLLLKFLFAVFCAFSAYSAVHRDSSAQLLNKYKRWEVAVRDTSNFPEVFGFFYNNPHWPLFDKCVREAEQHIALSKGNIDLLSRWFARYSPKTSDGTIAFMNCLLVTNERLAINCIKHLWVRQNFSDSSAIKFRNQFAEHLTTIDDARRVKHLMLGNKTDQLIAMKDIVVPQIKECIDQFLGEVFYERSSGYSVRTLNDPRKKLNIVKYLVNQNSISKAANILLLGNKNEEQFAKDFFEYRRRIACDLVRDGKAKLAYSVLLMHKLQPKSDGENYSKAEWLLGYISYRFLKDYRLSIVHFLSALDGSKADIRMSKNAFWLAEAYLHTNDILLAIDAYRKAARYFNTFYGFLARVKLFTMPPIKDATKLTLSDDRTDIPQTTVPTSALENALEDYDPNIQTVCEIRFYRRELVQTLIEISRLNTDKEVLKLFYLQLIDEIVDPNEELFLLDLACKYGALDILISSFAGKQHYFVKRKAFRILGVEDMKHVMRVRRDLCFKSIVHSVVYNESAFNQNAVSPVGAVGLMQIMPTTASYESKRIKFYVGDDVSLFNREKNLIIGSSIISRLLKKYKGNVVLAVAAYNCGEGNIAKFQKSIKNLGKLPYLDMIELIPFKETRIYVKRVLRAMFAYQAIFGSGECYQCPGVFSFDLTMMGHG
jgi:soluble lytic murein transglycosylase